MCQCLALRGCYCCRPGKTGPLPGSVLLLLLSQTKQVQLPPGSALLLLLQTKQVQPTAWQCLLLQTKQE